MFNELRSLLEQRESIIADHAFRDRDPDAHLQALREVSEAISTWTESNRSEIDPKLRHYLANASFQKALSHILDA